VTHPLGTMASPTDTDRRHAIITTTWLARESVGDTERALAAPRDGSEPDRLEALEAARSFMWSTARVALNRELSREGQAAAALEVAGHHLNSACAHLRTHIAYLDFHDSLPPSKQVDPCGDERRFAARAAGAGRRAAHVALMLLVEAWPQLISHED